MREKPFVILVGRDYSQTKQIADSIESQHGFKVLRPSLFKHTNTDEFSPQKKSFTENCFCITSPFNLKIVCWLYEKYFAIKNPIIVELRSGTKLKRTASIPYYINYKQNPKQVADTIVSYYKLWSK